MHFCTYSAIYVIYSMEVYIRQALDYIPAPLISALCSLQLKTVVHLFLFIMCVCVCMCSTQNLSHTAVLFESLNLCHCNQKYPMARNWPLMKVYRLTNTSCAESTIINNFTSQTSS